MNELLQPMIQVRANTAIIYSKWLGSRRKNSLRAFQQQQKAEIKNFEERKAYSGELTAGAIKRMSRALNLFVGSAERKIVYNPIIKKNVPHSISFITLTIPQNEVVELKTASKLLLEPLLRHLRQVHGMSSYVWKAEIQKRGQVHYHIVSDVFIHYQHLRNKWNQLLSKSGFNASYVAEKGHSDANSTDIHSLKKVKDLAAYFIKYFTKSEQNEVRMSGKLWDCSKNLKAARYFETELTEDIEWDLYRLQEEQKAVIKFRDSFTFIKFKGYKAVSVFPDLTKRAYYQHMFDIRNHSPNLFECSKNRNKKEDSCTEKRTLPQIMPQCYQLQLFLN